MPWFSHGYGRLPAFDKRDKAYLVHQKNPHLLASDKILEEQPTKFWRTIKSLDQGQTPQCVAYSGEGLLAAAPVINKQWKTPQELYNQCQAIDEWKDEPHDGTSVRALFKVLQSKGYVKEYNWALDVDTAARFILKSGPIIFGTDWYSGMFDPDSWGFIHVKGWVDGGHAYLIPGVSLTQKCPDGSVGAFQIHNSWGPRWAYNGNAWLSFKDAQKLINDQGDVALGVELVPSFVAAEDNPFSTFQQVA